MKRMLWSVAFVLGAFAWTGCSDDPKEVTNNVPGGSDTTAVAPKMYVGLTTVPSGVLNVADVVIRAESDGREVFADTLTEAGQSSYGTDAELDQLFAGLASLGFNPEKQVVYYRDLGILEHSVVWTTTSVLNAEKVAALTDTLVTVGRPWNGFVVRGESGTSLSFSMGSMTIRKSQLERYFEDTRHTVRTDTLFVR